MKAAPRPHSPTGRLPVRGSRGPPSGPPQVSKEAQRLLRSLLLPSPLGVATRPSRARPSLRLVPSHTAPCSQAPYKTSRPRRDRNGHSQLHYIFHHSRHLPGSFPSGREARSRSAQALGPHGEPVSSSFCAGATRARPPESERRRTSHLPGLRGQGDEGRVRRRDEDGRASRNSCSSSPSSTWWSGRREGGSGPVQK